MAIDVTFGDERALVSACKAGEEAALRSFYDRFFPPVFRYVLASIGHHHDAEDIATDVFVKAFRAVGTFEDQSRPVTAWLFRIARNEIIDHLRRRGRRIAATSMDQPQQIERRERYDPMETKGLLIDLSSALDALPGAHREAVLLRLVAGLSTREAATVMQIPEGTLRSHLHFGVKALREAMER